MANVDPDAQVVERAVAACDGVGCLMQECVGDSNYDPGETPARVLKAYREMTGGYKQDPSEFLDKVFRSPANDLVILRGIRVVSLCEHHLLPFTGTATVAYVPDDRRVCGLSKLARVVDAFARRFQMQERLSFQVAACLAEHPKLKPQGAACIITAKHSCLGCRGARQPDAEMTTSSLRGRFEEDHALRAELLRLHQG